jgi:hypothetical protein
VIYKEYTIYLTEEEAAFIKAPAEFEGITGPTFIKEAAMPRVKITSVEGVYKS